MRSRISERPDGWPKPPRRRSRAVLEPMSRALPTWEEVELADEKIGLFKSDLEAIASQVKAALEPVPLDDAIFMERVGIAVPESPPPDKTLVLRLIAFAAEVLEDAKDIAELAAELQHDALTLFHDSRGRDADPEGRQRSRAAIQEWHRDRAEALGDAA